MAVAEDVAADVVVVGAGVVGLASAAALARAGHSVVVLERGEGVARETSSRNSEVVHAGIYYEAGSLKAQLCVEGRHLLTAHCARHGVAHRRIGKWIVASDASEVPALESLMARGIANGVEGLELVDAERLKREEPHVRGAAALFSPATGIVDAHALALSYQAQLESHGGDVLLATEVVEIRSRSGGFAVGARTVGSDVERIHCGAVVNAAGLDSDRVAGLAGIDVESAGYRIHPCKGDYFSLAPGAPVEFRRLVYPLPRGGGLGVHATLDMAGRIRFGPDAEYVSEPSFDVDPAKAEIFAESIRRYLPEIESAWLSPDFAGVRPKLSAEGEAARDFVVAEESGRGLPGLVSCIGIESPGLTAAGAIAERVVSLLVSL